jgi:Tol biopolymer transport system component/DNA-binding winged helix-turn-helix (wHTH) protein
MARRISFGVYELDRDAMELRRRGVLIRLQEQPFRVLLMLAERPGEIVTREEIQEKIWGKTFVDFDQSLNKAINRVREALSDSAGTPQYVETIPRRGYRFIAPVIATPATEAPGPAAFENTPSTEIPAQPRWAALPSRIFIVAALAIAGSLAVIGIAAIVRWRQPKSSTLQEARLITSFGAQPALSRDGKLMAYASSVGDEPLHIWVQQTAGGEAIPVTTGPARDAVPDFSPDGTRIAFYSERKGGGIYTTSTLPGEPRLLVGAPRATYPRFSPTGDSILYWQNKMAFMVSVNGGQPASLPLNQDFIVYSPPIWSPDGKEVVFYGSPRREPNKPANWWIAPLAPGNARLLRLPGVTQNGPSQTFVRAWIRTADDREWILYSTTTPQNWKLWRIRISPRDTIDGTPEMVASGDGGGGVFGSPSRDGKLAYVVWSGSESIYQISISDRGQKMGPTFQLPLHEAEFHNSPSVSRDGEWMAYVTETPGKPYSIVLRNLSTGTEHLLDDKDLLRNGDVVTSISPDGSTVLFQRDCKEASFRYIPDDPLPCGFMVSAAGGEAEQICLRCTPRGFSSNGSLVLLQKYDRADPNKDRIVALDLRTKTEHDFLSFPLGALYHPFFSWDDRWVVFKKLPSSNLPEPPSQILIAPVRHGSPGAEAEWIPVTDGQHSDDKPQFSADGNTVYFTSTRDGYLCIWAQKLDPVTKHPLGSPFTYEHFHNSAGHDASIDPIASDMSVARNKILINLPEIHPAIWMTQMP